MYCNAVLETQPKNSKKYHILALRITQFKIWKNNPYTTWNSGSIENPQKLHIEISALFNSHKVREQCILKATTELQEFTGIHQYPAPVDF